MKFLSDKNKKKKKVVYIIGSLRNPDIPKLAIKIRKLGFEGFDSWYSPGPEADEFWRKYEKIKGSTYKQALNDWAAKHIYEFDKYHIDRADVGILVMPAGKSGHLELGYMIGSGKKCFVLFDKEPDRWDIMYQFAQENAGDVCFSVDELIKKLKKLKNK